MNKEISRALKEVYKKIDADEKLIDIDNKVYSIVKSKCEYTKHIKDNRNWDTGPMSKWKLKDKGSLADYMEYSPILYYLIINHKRDFVDAVDRLMDYIKKFEPAIKLSRSAGKGIAFGQAYGLGTNGLGTMTYGLGNKSLCDMLDIDKSKVDKTVELERSYTWVVKSAYADRFVIAILHRFYSEIASIDCVNNGEQTVFAQAESAFKRAVS